MKRVFEFFATHAEGIVYALAFAVVVTVIVPTINAYDEARYAAYLAGR